MAGRLYNLALLIENTLTIKRVMASSVWKMEAGTNYYIVNLNHANNINELIIKYQMKSAYI